MAFRKMFSVYLFLAGVLANAGVIVEAQVLDPVTAQQEPVPGAGHSYIGMGVETVNPADGSLSFNLPLQTPTGRQLNFPFSIRFNSTEPFLIDPNGPAGELQYTTPILNKTPAPFNVNGWSYTLPNYQAEAYVSSFAPVSSGCGNPDGNPCPGSNYNYCFSTKNYTFQGFDGLLLPLSIVNNWPDNDNPTPNACYQTTYPTGGLGANGVTESFGAPPAGTVGVQPPLAVTDRSGTTYQFPTGPGISTNPAVVPDGLTPFAALASTVTDRNGNQIKLNGTITSVNGAGLPAGNYLDTAGRSVVAWTGLGSASGDQVTVSGLPQSISLQWQQTTVTLPGTVNQVLGDSCTYNATSLTMLVVNQIVLPNGTAYAFDYGDSSGLLDKITFPDGGYVRYVWGANPDGNSSIYSWTGDGVTRTCAVTMDAPAITDRYVSLDGSTEVLHQHFDFASHPTQWTSVGYSWYWTAKTTTVTTSEYSGGGWTNTGVTTYNYSNSMVQNDSNGVAQEKTVVHGDGAGHTLQTVNTTWFDQYNMMGHQTVLDNGQGKTTLQCLDQFRNVTDIYEYDFQSQGAKPSDPSCSSASPSTLSSGLNVSAIGPLLRHTSIVYHPFFTANSTYITDEPDSVTVVDGSNNRISQTSYQYDQSAVSGSGAVSLVAPAGARGNATSVSQWLNTGGSLLTTYTYWDSGQIHSKTQPCVATGCSDVQGASAQTTIFVYTDSPTTGNPAGNSNAYLTQVTDPNTGVAHVRKYSYDYSFGLPVQSVDENTRPTTYQYINSLRRLTDVYGPSVGGVQPHTHYEYTDGLNATLTTTDPAGVQTRVVYDGMDHPVQHQVLGDPAGTDAIITTYDGLERIRSVSNPERSGSPSTSDGVTRTDYDALNRKTLQTNPDGSTETWTYSGSTTTFLDELSHQWVRNTDSLDRLISVIEPSNLETDYTYDLLDDLTRVDQGSGSGNSADHARMFQYDSLRRLTKVCNPEGFATGSAACSVNGPWSAQYTYDADSNLWMKTDANGVTSSNNYDALNRVIATTFSGGPNPTSSIAWDYDAGATSGNFVGRLADEYVGAQAAPVAKRSIQGYDSLGRAIGEQQCILGNCNASSPTVGYGYNLAGKLISTAVAGAGPAMTLSTPYDAAGRLSSLSTSYSGSQGSPSAFDAMHPDKLFSAEVASAYGPVGLIAPTYAILTSNGANGTPAITRQLGYDSRARRISDAYSSPSVTFPATSTVDVITIAAANPGVSTDQSKQVTGNPAAGSGSVTLSGAEKSYQICQPSGTSCRIVADGGSVTATVGGFSVTASYDSGSTTKTVAQALVNGLNASNSPVTATAPGIATWQSGQSIQITVTSSTTGSASNLSLSSNGVINEGGCSKGCHSTPDFALALSGPTLTGGHDATYTLYDTGSASAAINSTMVSVPWGQNDTTETVATKLANAIQTAAGSVVSASSSGSTITVSSVATGPNSGFTLSLADTYDSNDFATASFAPTLTTQTAGLAPHQGGGSLYTYSLTSANSSAGYDVAGNLTDFNDSVMGRWHNGYDNLNRLQAASVTGGPYDGMSLAWTIDPFGNRQTQMPTGHTPPQATPGLTFNNAQNHADQLIYDNAGNVNNDGSNVYLFDGLNRVCAVQGGGSGGSVTGYLYDAEGRRVAKGSQTALSCDLSSNGFTPTEVYVLNHDGVPFVTLDGTANWKRTDIFTENTLLGTYDPTGFHYALADWLETKRVQYSLTEGTESLYSSLPFGDSLTSTGGDATDRHFTSKERDIESGLDYFGVRYYASSTGRFISPDWAEKPEAVPYSDLMNPQSLNLYGYVGNNPLSKADDNGHCPECMVLADEALQYVSETPAGQAVGNAIGIAGAALGGFIATHASEIVDSYTDAVSRGIGSTGVYVGPIYNQNSPQPGPASPAAALPGNDSLHAPGDVPDDQTVVRGGQSSIPSSGTFSGAQGATVEEAGKGVPHGTVSATTAGDIRAAGGDVRPAPEPAYEGGPINGQHVNVTGGQSAFGPQRPNPAPKPDRIPTKPAN